MSSATLLKLESAKNTSQHTFSVEEQNIPSQIHKVILITLLYIYTLYISLYNSSTFCQNGVFWNFHLEKIFFWGEVHMTPPISDVANQMAPFSSKSDKVLVSSA